MDATKNSGRFQGFADLYDQVRPRMPLFSIEVINRYLGREPFHVVDMGCGTGLSTLAWSGHSKRVTGIEPSEDMIAVARTKESDSVHFIQAYSHDTGLDAGCADTVVCSQSFHWMDPIRTLAEVNRILVQGGVFATVDCDWPPVCHWQAEKAYEELFEKVSKAEEQLEQQLQFHKWDKNKHLANIRSSGYFRYAREIVFSNREDCTAERLIGLAESQGGLQGVLKSRPELLQGEWENFQSTIRAIFADRTFDIDFNYRMRIGIK